MAEVFQFKLAVLNSPEVFTHALGVFQSPTVHQLALGVEFETPPPQVDTFQFRITALAPSPSPVRLRNRLTQQGFINLDGRYQEVIDQVIPADTYRLVFTVSPLVIQPGASALVRVWALKNGLPLSNQEVAFQSDTPAVVQVADQLFLDQGGFGEYSIIGEDSGTATITATMVVDGKTVPGESAIVFTVVEIEPPEIYVGRGLGRVVFTSESPLANALHAKPERLSHAEQMRKYPGDRGLEYASSYEQGTTVTFLPWFLRKDT